MTILRRLAIRLKSPAAWRLGVVGSLLVLAAYGWVRAGAPAGHYQAYLLRHKQAAEVERPLGDLLRSLTPATSIVVDAANNQLLVQGDEAVQRIAAEYLDSVDVPPALPPVPDGPASVRAYRVAGSELPELCRRLEARYANRTDVRCTADASTGQLIVLAPPAVHEEIQRQLPATVNPSRPAAASSLGPPRTELNSAPARPAESVVSLRHASMEQLAGRLRELLGTRLTQVAHNPQLLDLTIRCEDGREVRVSLDGRRRSATLTGDAASLRQLERLIAVLDDGGAATADRQAAVRVLPVRRADSRKVHEALEAYRRGAPGTETGVGSASVPPDRSSGWQPPFSGPIALVQLLSPAEVPAQPEVSGPGMLNGQEAGRPPAALDVPSRNEVEPQLRELGGRVEIETLPDLDVIILRGRDVDVDEVTRIIEEIERLSAETIPEIDVYTLRYVHCLSIVQVIELVAEDLIGGRQGKIHVTPLVKPNALLLIGWGEAVAAMKELIARLDQPVPAESQLRVYRLQHAPVSTAAATVQDAFSAPQGLAARVSVIPDIRTNALIVRAAPRDLEEVDLLIQRIDQPDSGLVSQARVFKIRNTLATDLAATLQNAIAAAAGRAVGARSAALELITADVEGRRLLKSGVLGDVQITPDPHTNSLLIAAPAESMELLAALIEQLDSPTAVAQIKVFRIVNGDASSLVEMLRSLLPGELTVAGPQLAGAEGETNLVPVRFSVDPRTNSIIATGSQGDLAIIEALLMRLDEDDVASRVNTVYRLKNSPAIDVALAINELLRSRRVIEQAAPGITSAFELIEREVIVVPEPVSNALIISATTEHYDEVLRVVERLDEQPAQVMIQVVIAEVRLDNFDEFGVEFGLQDSVLFDRSVLSLIETITDSQVVSTEQGIITVQEQVITSAINTPGFNFNNQPLGDSGTKQSLASANRVGTQGLTSFDLGRTSKQLGYGGFVVSASSESVSLLIRALSQSRRIEVIGRPQIMTLDNQSAFIQVGERVPRITGSRFDGNAQTNSVELENTGLILGVTPRISPEGMVVMEVDAEKSKVGAEQDGIPVSVVENNVIRSPKISVTTAQTTVSAASGETIVIGGLITKDTDIIRRRVPFLSDLPILGNLFKYDSDSVIRSELLIFLTPRVIRGDEDLEAIKQAEAARMSWCLADVHELHGPTGIYEDPDGSCWHGQGEVVYPDANPAGLAPGQYVPEAVPYENLELIPTPESLPPPMGAEGSTPDALPKPPASSQTPPPVPAAGLPPPPGSPWPSSPANAP